jgi:tetratricopeptide (TPR) repeat protein
VMPAWVVVMVALLVVPLVMAEERGETPLAPEDASTTRLLDAYAAHPRRRARPLRKLARRGLAALPAPVLLAIADLQIRRGRVRSATSVLDAALAQNPGDPWRCWAELGLGWIRLEEGRTQQARGHLTSAADAPGKRGNFAALMLGLLDAAEGRSTAARQRLEEIAVDGSFVELQDAARLGVGYAHYWSHEYREAGIAWEEALPSLSGSILADDARYAAAIARHHAGDLATSSILLRDLAADHPDPRGNRSADLVELDAQAMLKATFTNYRRSTGPVRPPEARAVELINVDGVSLARAALRRIDGTEELRQPTSMRDFRRARTPLWQRTGVEARLSQQRAHTGDRDQESAEGTQWWPMLVVAGIVAVMLGRTWSRRSCRVGRHRDVV